jgi:hypothetical protein
VFDFFYDLFYLPDILLIARNPDMAFQRPQVAAPWKSATLHVGFYNQGYPFTPAVGVKRKVIRIV